MQISLKTMGGLTMQSGILVVTIVATILILVLLLNKKVNGKSKEKIVKYVTDVFMGFEDFHAMLTEQKEKLLLTLSADQLSMLLTHIKFGTQDQLNGFVQSISRYIHTHNTVEIGDKLLKIFNNCQITTKENGTFWVVKNKSTAKTDFVFLLREGEKFDHTDLLNLAIAYTGLLKDAYIKNTVSVKIFEVKEDGDLRICKTYTSRELTKFVARMLAVNPHLLIREDAK